MTPPQSLPVALLLLLLLSFAKVVTSSSGTDFVLAFPQCFYINDSFAVKLVVTPTSGVATKVTALAPAHPDLLNRTDTIQPGSHLWLKASGQLRLGYGTKVEDLAVSIHADHLVKVLGYNIQESNGDAYMAIADQELGMEYYGVCYYPLVSTGACFVTVSAATDGTGVRIQLPPLAHAHVVWLNQTEYRGHDLLTLTLNRSDVFQLQVLDDLTGTHVTADRPIAVQAGFNRSSIYVARCLSHGITQLRPTYLWGTRFVTVPYPSNVFNATRSIVDIYRVTCLYANTTVTVGDSSGHVVVLGMPGDFHEWLLGLPTFIRADKPVQVVQIVTSGNSGDVGDPAMQDLVPMTFAKSHVLFSTIQISWRVVLAIIANASDVSGVRLDTQVISPIHWFPANGSDHVVGYAEIQPTNEPHTLSHVTGQGLLGYTFATPKCESFALPIDIGSRSDRTMCGTQTGHPGDGVDNDCDGLVDEDVCCANDPSQSADNLPYTDCSAPRDFSEQRVKFGEVVRVCCNPSGDTYTCMPSQKSAHFSMSERGVRRMAERMTTAPATRLLDCAFTCAKDLRCWGVNVAAGSDVRCELLSGLSAGRRYDSAWRFFPMQAVAESYAPLII